MHEEPERPWQNEVRNPATSAQRLTELSADPLLRRSVADNPSAPAELLEQLAEDQDPQVRQAVVGNPNTPWPIMERLAWEFPHAFLYNPVGALQLLAYPGQISTDGTFWGGLLREAAFPPVWWHWLQSHRALRVHPALCLHVQEAGETPHFAGDPQEEEGILLILVELLAAAAEYQRMPLPTHSPPNQTEPMWAQVVGVSLQRLAQSVDVQMRRKAAANVQTPMEILLILAQDQDARVREEVARNSQTPTRILCDLVQDRDAGVQRLACIILRLRVEVEELLQEARREEWHKQRHKFLRKLFYHHGSVDTILEKQLGCVADLDVPESVRQAIITILAAEWDAAVVQAAFSRGTFSNDTH